METPELIVVREKKSNAQVAQDLYELLLTRPHQHEVPFLAEELGVPQDQVVHILHNYGPDGQGGVERRPDGQGGGWLPEEVADQHRTLRSEPTEIGYRWPDNQLRDEVFDFKNPDHRETVGLPPLEEEAPQG